MAERSAQGSRLGRGEGGPGEKGAPGKGTVRKARPAERGPTRPRECRRQGRERRPAGRGRLRADGGTRQGSAPHGSHSRPWTHSDIKIAAVHHEWQGLVLPEVRDSRTGAPPPHVRRRAVAGAGHLPIKAGGSDPAVPRTRAPLDRFPRVAIMLLDWLLSKGRKTTWPLLPHEHATLPPREQAAAGRIAPERLRRCQGLHAAASASATHRPTSLIHSRDDAAPAHCPLIEHGPALAAPRRPARWGHYALFPAAG